MCRHAPLAPGGIPGSALSGYGLGTVSPLTHRWCLGHGNMHTTLPPSQLAAKFFASLRQSDLVAGLTLSACANTLSFCGKELVKIRRFTVMERMLLSTCLFEMCNLLTDC